jgi:hypothetical protein
MGQIVRVSDCHSQHLHPLLSGRTERFGGGQTVRPLWGRIVTICIRLWGESLQCRMVQVGVSQCLNRGWPNHQGTDLFSELIANCIARNYAQIICILIPVSSPLCSWGHLQSVKRVNVQKKTLFILVSNFSLSFTMCIYLPVLGSSARILLDFSLLILTFLRLIYLEFKYLALIFLWLSLALNFGVDISSIII